MAAAKLVLLLVLISIPYYNCEDNYSYMKKVLGAVEKLVQFYKGNYHDLNLDGLFGLRAVEGHLHLILEEHKNGSHAWFSPQVLSRLQSLAAESTTVSNQALEYVKNDDESYFDNMRYVVEQPWNILHKHRKLDPELRWTPKIYKASKDFLLSEEESDRCMGGLTGNNPQKKTCLIDQSCLNLMTTKGTTEYGITHQLLFTMLAEKTNCLQELSSLLGSAKETSVSKLQTEFCTNNFYEMAAVVHIYMQGKITSGYQDLFLEQQFVCPSLGFYEFLKQEYIDQILSWQLDSGCFGQRDYNTNELEKQKEKFMQHLEKMAGGSQNHSTDIPHPKFQNKLNNNVKPPGLNQNLPVNQNNLPGKLNNNNLPMNQNNLPGKYNNNNLLMNQNNLPGKLNNNNLSGLSNNIQQGLNNNIQPGVNNNIPPRLNNIDPPGVNNLKLNNKMLQRVNNNKIVYKNKQSGVNNFQQNDSPDKPKQSVFNNNNKIDNNHNNKYQQVFKQSSVNMQQQLNIPNKKPNNIKSNHQIENSPLYQALKPIGYHSSQLHGSTMKKVNPFIDQTVGPPGNSKSQVAVNHARPNNYQVNRNQNDSPVVGRKLLVEKEMKGGCMAHNTAVASGALIMYLRYLIDPGPMDFFGSHHILQDNSRSLLGPVDEAMAPGGGESRKVKQEGLIPVNKEELDPNINLNPDQGVDVNDIVEEEDDEDDNDEYEDADEDEDPEYDNEENDNNGDFYPDADPNDKSKHKIVHFGNNPKEIENQKNYFEGELQDEKNLKENDEGEYTYYDEDNNEHKFQPNKDIGVKPLDNKNNDNNDIKLYHKNDNVDNDNIIIDNNNKNAINSESVQGNILNNSVEQSNPPEPAGLRTLFIFFSVCCFAVLIFMFRFIKRRRIHIRYHPRGLFRH